MLFQELLAFSMTEAEEYYINLLKGHVVGKSQVCIADKPFMHIAYRISCIALGVGKHNLCFRVIQQHTYQLATRVTCRA